MPNRSPLRYTIIYTILLALVLLAWLWFESGQAQDSPRHSSVTADPAHDQHSLPMTQNETAKDNRQYRKAVFAGGCFWCMEHPYDELDGVIETISGYAGGHAVNPSYEDVVGGDTGHAESVKVVYDPQIISYRKLLEVYWRNIDPTTPNRQFCDVGEQYRTAIFYTDDEQRAEAEASLQHIQEHAGLPGPVVTAIEPLNAFYPAEAYHQDFYRKNPVRYKMYRYACGRDARLAELWGKSE